MNKGFISFIFLTFFLQFLFYFEIFMLKLNTQNKLFISMQEVNQRISLEALLIDEINCILKNEEEIDHVQIDDEWVTIKQNDKYLEAVFQDGYTVIIEIKENQVYSLEIR